MPETVYLDIDGFFESAKTAAEKLARSGQWDDLASLVHVARMVEKHKSFDLTVDVVVEEKSSDIYTVNCSEGQWDVVVIVLRSMQALIESRKNAGKSTAIDQISTEITEKKARRSTIHWSELCDRPDGIS